MHFTGNQLMVHHLEAGTSTLLTIGSSYSVPSGVQDKKTILAGTYKFTPDEVEVFYLG